MMTLLRLSPYVSTLYLRAHFDGTLVGFGTRVAEEYSIQPGAAADFCQLAVRGSVIQVGGVLQGRGLVCHGLDPGGVAVAQGS